jgi:hypothetical protein
LPPVLLWTFYDYGLRMVEELAVSYMVARIPVT